MTDRNGFRHAIEAHRFRHLRATLYVEQKGLTAYLQYEALPSMRQLRDEGFDLSTYPYPAGARTSEAWGCMRGGP